MHRVEVGAVRATWQRWIGKAYGRGRPDVVNASAIPPFHVSRADWLAPTPLGRERDAWRVIALSGAGRMAATCPGGRGLLLGARRLILKLKIGQIAVWL